MDENYNEVLRRIHALMKQRGWSRYRLAKMSNVADSTIKRWYDRNNCPTVPMLKKICDGFSITLSEFFDDGVIERENTYILDENETYIIEKYRTIKKKEKEIAMRYFKTMV